MIQHSIKSPGGGWGGEWAKQALTMMLEHRLNILYDIVPIYKVYNIVYNIYIYYPMYI